MMCMYDDWFEYVYISSVARGTDALDKIDIEL